MISPFMPGVYLGIVVLCYDIHIIRVEDVIRINYLTHSHVWVELLIFTRCMHLNIRSYKSNNMGVAKSQVVWSSFTLPIAVLSS